MPGPSPKLFTPLTIRGVTIPNRIAVSPMAMYSADRGYPEPFHHAHYVKLAMSGAGLVFIEETAVTETGRITNGCLGLWNDKQIPDYLAITKIIGAMGAKSAIQISHGGRKCSAQRALEGNGPLTPATIAERDEVWKPVDPSGGNSGESM